MGSILQNEIKQTRPFESLEAELWLNLSRTTAMASHVIDQALRPHGLSSTQYNVLRILRGAGGKGLCQYEIGERLVAQVPDVPRIVERMEKAGWVQRERGVADRRIVMASLTAEGLSLVMALDEPVQRVVTGIFDALSQDEMVNLIDLLSTARKCHAEAGPAEPRA